jgi:hypothetical protein
MQYAKVLHHHIKEYSERLYLIFDAFWTSSINSICYVFRFISVLKVR